MAFIIKYSSFYHLSPCTVIPFYNFLGGSEAICVGWSDVRWMPGHTLWWEVCTLLLRQRHLPAVLLRVLLGQHPFPCWPGVPQTTGEGGRRSATPRSLSLELSIAHVTHRRSRAMETIDAPSDLWKKLLFVFFCFINVIIYSHLTELSVQYHASLQSVTVLNFALWFISIYIYMEKKKKENHHLWYLISFTDMLSVETSH